MTFKSLVRDPLASLGVVILCVWFATSLTLLCVSSLNFVPMDLADRLAAPSQKFWFGVDSNGQSVGRLLVCGAYTAFVVSLCTILTSCILGTILGAFAGYYGGKIDFIISRIIDILLAFPPMILPIAIMAFFGSGLWNVVMALSVTGWVVYARLVRGQFLSLKERNFILSAQSLGASPFRIMFLHMLPNVLSPLFVQTVFSFSSVILAEAGLSFLGLGAGENTVSWGGMLSTAREELTTSPSLTFFPALAIFCVVTALNFVGEFFRRQLGHSSGQ